MGTAKGEVYCGRVGGGEGGGGRGRGGGKGEGEGGWRLVFNVEDGRAVTGLCGCVWMCVLWGVSGCKTPGKEKN